MIYIHHHLGLGDHIVCNAIVREQYNNFGPITLAVKKHNYSSVKQLYNDINIQYHQVDSDSDCYPNYFRYPTLRIGFEKCRSDWERSFYDQMGMNYSDRFTKFYIRRDESRESDIRAKLNLPERYAFCNFRASSGKHSFEAETKLPKVFLEPLSDSIFDWIGIIENAEEIHTIDSSIFQLVKQLKVTENKFFYDTRKLDSTRTIPTFEDDKWKILYK